MSRTRGRHRTAAPLFTGTRCATCGSAMRTGPGRGSPRCTERCRVLADLGLAVRPIVGVCAGCGDAAYVVRTRAGIESCIRCLWDAYSRCLRKDYYPSTIEVGRWRNDGLTASYDCHLCGGAHVTHAGAMWVDAEWVRRATGIRAAYTAAGIDPRDELLSDATLR